MARLKELLSYQKNYDTVISALYQSEYYSKGKPYFIDYAEKNDVIDEGFYKFPIVFNSKKILKEVPYLSSSHDRIREEFRNSEIDD